VNLEQYIEANSESCMHFFRFATLAYDWFFNVKQLQEIQFACVFQFQNSKYGKSQANVEPGHILELSAIRDQFCWTAMF